MYFFLSNSDKFSGVLQLSFMKKIKITKLSVAVTPGFALNSHVYNFAKDWVWKFNRRDGVLHDEICLLVECYVS